MYKTLTPRWAGTLLGCLEILIIPIPFVFYRYGHRIRMRSPLIRSMQKDKTKLAGKTSRGITKQEGRQAEEKDASPEEVV